MNRDDLEKLSKDELVELVLKLQRPPKMSRTSSKPPSTDRKAKRENAKPGGAKPGHKGHWRRLADHPDQTVDHRPDRCPNCGSSVTPDLPAKIIGEFDRIDLPPIRPFIERHRRLACTCPGCGARVKAAVPEAATGSPFGPGIAAMAFYLKHLHHVSFQRLERLFADMFGLAISQGALCNLLQRGGARFETQKAELLTRLRQAEAIASDETGVRIEGVGAQHWVFRSPDVVLHEVAFSRGANVVRDIMDGHRPAYWTSDRYSAQQGHGQAHQTCLAHLARDAAWVLEAGSERIGLALKLWFNDVFALARAGLAASTVRRKRRALEHRIDGIVRQTTDCEETRKVLRKIANARDQLLTFLDAPDGLVDPTNNACERRLRPAVINRKVTNGFRSLWGAKADAALRSSVDTGRLNGLNPFDAITQTLATR